MPRIIFATCYEGVDIYIDGSASPSCSSNAIFNEQNWTPGDSITKEIKLKNLTGEYVKVDLKITKQESGILEKKLKIAIRDWNDNLIYGPKTLQEFFSNSIMAFPNIGPNLTNTYKFTIEFPPADNSDDNLYNYNDKIPHEEGAVCNTIFDLQFHFEGTDTTEKPRSNGPLEWFWQNMNPGTGEPIIKGISKIATSVLPKLPTRLPRVGAWSALILAGAGLVWTTTIYLRKKK